jgi:hypothetical protein
MARPRGWRTVKSHRNYTIEEIARDQRVAKGTVLRWLKSGLPCLKDQRPFLILGHDLITFFKAKTAPKHTMEADQCFCFKCKAPRYAAFAEAEYRPRNAATGQLRMLCCECTTIMNKNISLDTLEALKPKLRLSFSPGHERISETAKTYSNDHNMRA